MTGLVSLWCLSAALLAQPGASGVEWKLEVRSCAEAAGTFVKGGACWVIDPVQGRSTYEYQACIGVVLDAGILVAGAQASVMLCGTMTVPVDLVEPGKDEVWKAVARDRLKQSLAKPEIRASLVKAIKSGTIRGVEVGPVREPDPATTRQIKDALKSARPVN